MIASCKCTPCYILHYVHHHICHRPCRNIVQAKARGKLCRKQESLPIGRLTSIVLRIYSTHRTGIGENICTSWTLKAAKNRNSCHIYRLTYRRTCHICHTCHTFRTCRTCHSPCCHSPCRHSLCRRPWNLEINTQVIPRRGTRQALSRKHVCSGF